MSSVYELPWGRGRRWLNNGFGAIALGGWNLASIFTLQAGSPIGLTTQSNTTNAFTFGNSGRAILQGPGLAVFNFSLLKNFAFTERWNLQFRMEAFNAFNRANFQEPGRALGAATFGVISAADPGRQVQLGRKLTF